MEPIGNTVTSLAVQVVGVLTVAAVTRPFACLVPGRSLTYWWTAWVALAWSLGLVFAAVRAEAAGYWFAPGLVAGFCLADYLFGFLIWAGCRTLDSADGLRPAEWWRFAPFAAVAVLLPALIPDLGHLLPVHAAVAGMPHAAALWAARPRPGAAGGSSPGRWLLRLAVAGQVVLFWHYPVAAGLADAFDREAAGSFQANWKHMLLAAELALGMVSVAADRVQAELARRNLQLATATEALARVARTDPLTGLLNRRALDDLSAELAARPVGGCLAALDLNDLKPLNDRHGHAAGDAALQVSARTLRTLFRVTDPIFRTGGDEFMVVLPGGAAADLTARLSALDGGMAVRLPGAGDREVTLTMAWGVAEFGPGDDLWSATQEADAAMYLAKKKAKSGDIGVPAARVPPPAPPGSGARHSTS